MGLYEWRFRISLAGSQRVAAAGGGDVSFTRDQTIMQGAPSCTFRYKFAPR